MQRLSILCSALVFLTCIFASPHASAADDDVCAICGRPFTDVYYSIEDKVTHQKKHVCKQCELLPDCFVCGLPANTNDVGYLQLPDHRVLCARDARTAVLRQDDGVRICKEVQDELDRSFSRFTSFPDENVTIDVMDRVSLQTLFKLVGNDYQCPNVWGITQTETNKQHRLQFHISLMTGLPLSWFQATCAHEYGHTWVAEHLSYERKNTLDRDAEEAFCELLAFALMETRNDRAQQEFILRNGYTRGQIDQFVAAYHTYGFNEVLDWLVSGADGRLSAADPERIRKLSSAPAPKRAAQALVARTEPRPAPTTLVLKSIIWDKNRPLAMINDRTLGPDEVARVRVGSSNILVRCVSISPNQVRLRFPELNREQVLELK